MRAGSSNIFDPIDAVFELTGPMGGCYISRAWNAARTGPPEEWEFWEDESSRPWTEPRLATLKAADAACSPSIGLGDPMTYLVGTMMRLSAAATKLSELRRETIRLLQELDQRFTVQWLTASSTSTVTAGLAVASAGVMFACPPAGMALGMATASSSGVAAAANYSADELLLVEFRRLMANDVWHSFAVSELQKDWLCACDAIHQTAGSDVKGEMLNSSGSNPATARVVQSAIDGSLTSGSLAVSAGGSVTRLTQAAAGADKAVVMSEIFGLFGALVATGVACRSWCTTNVSQKEVRLKKAEMIASVLYTQRWLSELSLLECPLCLKGIEHEDMVQRCSGSWHYMHSGCVEWWAEQCSVQFPQPRCPECRGELAPESKDFETLITSDVKRQLLELRRL